MTWGLVHETVVQTFDGTVIMALSPSGNMLAFGNVHFELKLWRKQDSF
jgi:hypothetical protein